MAPVTGIVSCNPPLPTLAVSGTVRDETRTPLEGASILFGFNGKGAPGFSAKTDSAGQFHGTLPQGSYQYHVDKPGFDSFSAGAVVSSDTFVEVTLHPGVSVTGLVTELGVGPLDDVTIEVISGPSAGVSTVSGRGVSGRYTLAHLVPGDFTVRASKSGYEPVQQTVHASTSQSADFVLKWSYGTCLQSVTPVVLGPFSSTGGTDTVTVLANAGRAWTATPDSPWIELLSPSSQTGAGKVLFRVLANPGTSNPRMAALLIRCSASEGQNVWITQSPNCQIRLEATSDTPTTFTSDGGLGYLVVHPGTTDCRWTATSQAHWIGMVGDYVNRTGSPRVEFQVLPNKTGTERNGTVLVGDTHWQVRQR